MPIVCAEFFLRVKPVSTRAKPAHEHDERSADAHPEQVDVLREAADAVGDVGSDGRHPRRSGNQADDRRGFWGHYEWLMTRLSRKMNGVSRNPESNLRLDPSVPDHDYRRSGVRSVNEDRRSW